MANRKGDSNPSEAELLREAILGLRRWADVESAVELGATACGEAQAPSKLDAHEQNTASEPDGPPPT